MEDDDNAVRRILGIALIEAARKAGADPVSALASPPPPQPDDGEDEADDCDFFGY